MPNYQSLCLGFLANLFTVLTAMNPQIDGKLLRETLHRSGVDASAAAAKDRPAHSDLPTVPLRGFLGTLAASPDAAATPRAVSSSRPSSARASDIAQLRQEIKTAIASIGAELELAKRDADEAMTHYRRLNESHQLLLGFSTLLATHLSDLLHANPALTREADKLDQDHARYERELRAIFAPRDLTDRPD